MLNIRQEPHLAPRSAQLHPSSARTGPTGATGEAAARPRPGLRLEQPAGVRAAAGLSRPAGAGP